MNLLLVCETQIIEQIFSLVCKKLKLDFSVQGTTAITGEYDFIIVDQEFIDDKFNIIKQYTRKLGAITSEELPFEKSRDFIIPRPFLPTKLQDILREQVHFLEAEILKEQKLDIKPELNTDIYDENNSITPITDYVESLVEDVYLDINDEENEDESLVKINSSNTGGILDNQELSKLHDMLEDSEAQRDLIMDSNDWKDIGSIIDDALDEVKEYEFDLEETTSKKPLNLVLSNYNIEELKPLLEKFNQGIIDRLSAGESVDIRLVLKDKN
ncbi:hypothetical protein [Poseidonibacter sp.]|uniref:hypothetical protein n=1 Tax=Poseidonibacter sp. TaxID=2321188 RepID=UPI003C745AD5